MDNNEILENTAETDEFNNIIELTDEDGNVVQFEFLDIIEYESKEYVIFLPLDEEEEDAGEVVILQLEEHEEDEEYLSVEDEAVLEAVFNIFKDKYKDEFNFVD